MDKEDIIKSWKMGLSKFQVAEEYKKKYNKIQKQKKVEDRDKEINSRQALAYVEPILYKYQMNALKG